MRHLASILGLTIVALCASCAVSPRPSGRATVGAGQDDAAQHLGDSGYLKAVAQRLGEPSGLRYSLESSEPDGYIFWVFEDRPTHAVTIDWVKVAPDGRVFILDVPGDQWMEAATSAHE